MPSTLPKIALTAGLILIVLPLLAAVGVISALGALAPGSPATPSRRALADIPPDYLALYQRAAPACPGLDWSVLAAIGKIETDHGRVRPMVSSAGAIGPMQFLPATFRGYAHPVPPGGKKPPTPWDPTDAVFAASRLLCANGARHSEDLQRAIYRYNHSHAYVRDVLAVARGYRGQPTPAPNLQAARAIAYTRHHLGEPYRWGGDSHADGGFDCSGLTKAAYAAAGITLPRTAEEQYHATAKIPRNQPLLPGDLVFYGRPGNLHHVGLYLGNGQMINAPHPGARIRIENYHWTDYWGATRPTTTPHTH